MQISPVVQRGLVWLAIAATAVLLLWLLGPVLTPFVVACVFAYALAPVVARVSAWHVPLGKKRWPLPRVLAVALVEMAFLLLMAALVLLVVPIVIKEIPLLREQIPVLAQRLNDWLTPLLANFGVTAKLDVASIKAFVVKYLSTNAEDGAAHLLSSLRIGGSVLLTVLGNAFLIPVVLFYLLFDWPHLVERARAFVPPRMRARVDGFLQECDDVLGQYLRGQLMVMALLAVYFSVGLALFGLDLALPIGAFTGLAIFVPYVGFGIGLLLALLAGMLQFSLAKAAFMVLVVYGIGQVLESVVLTPRLVGERIGLHPLAVIFALLAFGQLFGFVGVLVALPASAVLLVALRRARDSYLSSALYKG
jgi:predicted PurR-regulated permease PerM